jgi:prevent-host-death family protein
VEPVNIHEAKTQFSRIVDRAARGETVVIAKHGHPVAKLVPLDAVGGSSRSRTGFLTGHISVPDDFDRMGSDSIDAVFLGPA